MPFAPGNAQHIGDRQQQQDSFGFSNPEDEKFLAHGGFLGIVADGMGGLAHGAEASRTAVRAFLSVYESRNPGEPIPATLDRAVRQANASVHALGADIGTTLAAAVVRGRELYWVSVGDSHIYLLRNGRQVLLNAEHNYGAELYRQVAAGSVTRLVAETHPERDHLTSYLGSPEIAITDINIKPFPLRPGDLIVICSDGVYRTLPKEELLASFAHSDISRACESVIEKTLARRKPHQDNATVIAWQCLPPDAAPASAPAPARAPGGNRSGWWIALSAVFLALCLAGWIAWKFLTFFRGGR